MPLPESNFTVVASAHGPDGSAFLLRTVNPVWKPIVRSHVVELRCRLVIPSAPGGAPIHTDDRALIAGKCHGLRMLAADPNTLVVIATRSAPESNKRFAAVTRFPSGGVRHVDDIRIVRCDR